MNNNFFSMVSLFLILVSALQAQNLTVKVDPQQKAVEVSQSFEVKILIENVTNLGGFQMDITYQTNVLHADTAVIGGFLGSTGRAIVPINPIIDNSGEVGKLMISGVAFGNQAGPTGNGILAIVTFISQNVGTSSIELKNVQVGDVNGQTIAINSILSGQVDVTGDSGGDPVLFVYEAGLNYSNSYTSRSFKILNHGGGNLTWNIPSKPAWISAVTPSSGTGETIVTVTVDRTGLIPGSYFHPLEINSNGGNTVIDISISAGPNMIVNGDFTSANATWDFYNHGTSTATWALENEEYVIDIQNKGMESWHVQLFQSPVVLIQGKTYEVFFDAYAQQAGQIQVQAGMAVDPWTPYYNGQYFNLTTLKQTFTFSFKMEAADDWNCRLLFNLAYGVNKIYFDNIVMREKGGSSVQYNISQMPETCQLEANFPNPFNPSTNLRFSVVESSRVQLDIFDVNGRLIETLLNGIKSPGSYTMPWQARNLPGGVYFCRFIATPENGGNDVVQTRKLLLLK